MLEFKSVIEPNLLGIQIQFNSLYCGLHLRQISLPLGCTVLGILRSDQVIPVADDPTIDVGDYILAMAIHPMILPALKVTLKQTHPVYCSLNACLLASNPEKNKDKNSYEAE